MSWTAPRTWVYNELVDETDLNTHVRDNLLFLKSNPLIAEASIAVGTANSGSVNAGEVQVLSTGAISIPADVGAVHVEAWGHYFTSTPSAGHNNWGFHLREAVAGSIGGLNWYGWAGAGPSPAPYYVRSQDLAWAGTSRTVSLLAYGNGCTCLALTSSGGTGLGGTPYFFPTVLRIVRSY